MKRDEASCGFRVVWLLVTALGWGVALFLSTQHSDHPDVLGRYSWKYAAVLALAALVASMLTIANWPPLVDRLYGFRLAGTVLAMSLVVGVVFVEMATRILDPFGISYYEETGRYHLDKIADEVLIYRHPAGWKQTYQGVEVVTNELGLRDDPIREKAGDEIRILALGDSVTFGWGVQGEQTFARRLEYLLSRQLGRPVSVINTGVGSYNTVQEEAFLKHFGLSLQPDLVILLYVNNDIEVHKRPFDPWSERSMRGKSPPELAMLLLGRSWFFRLAVHAIEHGGFGRSSPASTRMGSGQDSGWTASMDALRSIVRLTEEHRLPLGVFFFRWSLNGGDMKLLQDVRDAAGRVPVGDVGEWFAGKDISGFMNSRVDSHPNAEGHRLIAEGMAEFLLRHNMLVRVESQPH